MWSEERRRRDAAIVTSLRQTAELTKKVVEVINANQGASWGRVCELVGCSINDIMDIESFKLIRWEDGRAIACEPPVLQPTSKILPKDIDRDKVVFFERVPHTIVAMQRIGNPDEWLSFSHLTYEVYDKTVWGEKLFKELTKLTEAGYLIYCAGRWWVTDKFIGALAPKGA